MKTTTKKWMRRAFVALLGGALTACSGEESRLLEPGKTEDTGEVSFSISNGSNGAPSVVNGAGTADVTISQRSTYQDPDGSTFTCEPKANIKVSAAQDTICVKDLQALVSVAERSNTTSQSSSGSVSTQLTVQKFDVGGQEVTFDVAYEIYKHTNSQNRSIEMPYVKVGAARYGAADTKEQTRSGGGMAVTGIRLTPVGGQTRGTLTDSTMYEVSVSFTIGIESVHTKSAQAENVGVVVNYIGVVENTTEYPDPTVDFGYTLSVLGGTASKASPFEVAGGGTLALQWDESSRYSYFSVEELSQQTILRGPKVKVELTAAADTVFVDDKADLEQATLGEPDGDTADGTVTASQTVSIGGQTLTFRWSYDTVDDVAVDGGSVAMPYLTLGQPEVVSVSLSEPQDAQIGGSAAKVYEVTARIRQQLAGVNTEETIAESVEYVVKYVGVQKIKLVKVVYRKDWEWVEAHDNLPLAYYPIVYRDRIYSNGETYTDTFRDFGHISDYISSGEIPSTIIGEDANRVLEENGSYVLQDVYGQNIIYWRMTMGQDNAYAWGSSTIGVPNLSNVRPSDIMHYLVEELGKWDLYVVSKTYEGLDITDSDVEFVGSSGTSDRPSGWYMWSGIDRHYKHYDYVDGLSWLFRRNCSGSFTDQYLVIDGQRITFSEYMGTDKFTESERDITMPNGAPAKEFTLKGERTYYDKKFTVIGVDTIYQIK